MSTMRLNFKFELKLIKYHRFSMPLRHSMTSYSDLGAKFSSQIRKPQNFVALINQIIDKLHFQLKIGR